MKATAKKLQDGNYLPVIVRMDGTRVVLYGAPLATRKTAMKYAQIEINSAHTRRSV